MGVNQIWNSQVNYKRQKLRGRKETEKKEKFEKVIKNLNGHLDVGVYDDWEKELEKIYSNFAEGIAVWSRCICHEDGKKS